MLSRKKLYLPCILLVMVFLAAISLPQQKACAISGTTITEYSTGLTSLSRPIDICAGPDGALWFTESNNNKIGRITTAGVITEYGTGMPAGTKPIGIAAGPDGALWFTMFGSIGIGRITTAGAITEYSTGLTMDSLLSDICAGPDGALWFTESNDRIGRITTAGAITEYGTGLTAGSYPSGICTGPDGALWFTELTGNRIGRITTAGVITEYGTGLTSGSKPDSICAGPDGAVWFTELTGNMIGRITTAGAITEYTGLSTGSKPSGICAGHDGALWFTEAIGNMIGRITTSGTITEYDGLTVGSGPQGICAGPDGALWFTENNGDRIGRAVIHGDPWYLAEGCTEGGMETWVLVQNPNPSAVTVDLMLMTDSGPQSPAPLQHVSIPANSRTSFNLGTYVQTWNVSTKVTPTGGDVICERAVYGEERTWGTDSIGTTTPAATWYLAEGATDGGMETYVLVQNPNASDVTVDLTFMTSSGSQSGPHGVTIPANSRHSFNVGDSVVDYNVSTKVVSTGGSVVCERSMYGNGRTWAHDSVGVANPSSIWYMAEGATAGDFETWVLVQNPNATAVTVDLTFMTSAGSQPGPHGVSIPANSRHSFNVGEYVTDYNVSTRVETAGGDVICERAVYGGDRTWGTDSIGATATAFTWYLAEGCTGEGFETWVLVQNPFGSPATVDLTFMTSTGPQAGPHDVIIPAWSRASFNVGEYVTDYNVSTRVESSGGIVVERAMYGNEKQWAHDSVGYAQ